jgi:adenosylmethionine-8-amino-7-oxononanoate aminotransferase
MPYCYRCAYKCNECAAKYAKELELALADQRGTVAAFIAEPMSGATLGAVAPPEGYFERIREICDTHGVLFIADEVMTGCGRTGRNFAMEHFGATPDILVVAKGLSSGYMPLGAVLASERVVQVLEQGSGMFTHGFTYNAHPLAVAGGHAVMEIMRSQALVQVAAELETTMRRELEKLLEIPGVGDVRGKGLLWGVEFVESKPTKSAYPAEFGFSARVGASCAKRGVMVYPMQGCVDGTLGDHLLIAPPALITPAEIAAAVSVIGEAVQEAVASTQ